MTKRTLPLVAAFMLTPIAAGIAQAAPAGRVLMVVGEAAAERGNQKIALKRGTLVEEGDRLTTAADSSVQVMFTDQGLIALRENTRFKIEKFSFQQGADTANFKLEKGGVRTVTGQVGKASNKDYSLDAVVATIGIRGTNFELVLCEGQCADGGAAKNGLYGVVRGASGGTSRITISNDSGEKLLGKNDAFFVADKNSPAQQLVAPPSFVTARTESSKKSADKPSEDKKAETKTSEKTQEKTQDKAQDKEAAKSDGAKTDNTKADQAKTDSSNTSTQSGTTISADTSTTTASATSAETSTSTANTTTANTTTSASTTANPTTTDTFTSKTSTALVPPPSNQGTLATTTVAVSVAPTTPPLSGGTTSSTPGGTTVANPAPAPAPAPSPNSISASFVQDSAAGLTPIVFGQATSQITYAADGIAPVTFKGPAPSAIGTIAIADAETLSQGQLSGITVDGHTTANNKTEYVWGRWGGAAVTRNLPSASTNTLTTLPDLATNLHFVAGPLLQNTPTTGYAAYKLFGATSPSNNVAGNLTQYGSVSKADGDTNIFGTATTDPIMAKVGFSFGTTLPPFLLISPFRLNGPTNGDYLLIAGEGTRPNAPKPTLLSGALFNGAPSISGLFFGNTNGLYDFSNGNGVFNPGYTARFAGQLMDNAGGGLAVSYALNILDAANHPGVVNGSLVFRKDPGGIANPTLSAAPGALSLAAFNVPAGSATPSPAVNGFASMNVQKTSGPTGGMATNPTAFFDNNGALMNFGNTAATQTPIIMDDNGGANGYRWGRWASPAIAGGGFDTNRFAGGAVAHIRDNAGNTATNLHFVTGPELSALPQTGFASYTLIGHTTPSSELGTTGTLSRPDGTDAIGVLKASLGFKFSNDASIPPFLRIDSFKIFSGPTDSVIVSGSDSLFNSYTPIQLNADPNGKIGYFLSSNNDLWGTNADNPSPIRVADATANLRGQLMGTAGSGLGVSYAINIPANMPQASGNQIIGSMVFSSGAVSQPIITQETGAVVANVLSFDQATPNENGLILENVTIEQKAIESASISLHDGNPVSVIFSPAGNPPQTYTNYGSSPAVTIEGTDGNVRWGRWNGGNIVPTTNGQPDFTNTIGMVQFVSGPALTNLPASGSASYKLFENGSILGATTPYATDGTLWALKDMQGQSPTTLYATVSFGANPTMSMSGFKLAGVNQQGQADPTRAIYVSGNATLFNGSSTGSPAPIQFTSAGTTGRFTPNNALSFDVNGTASGTANLTGQLMGNGATGLGVVYSVTRERPNSTIIDGVSGALYLKKQ